MKCGSCSNRFDEFKHVPRLLIKCGHTVCQECLIKLFNNGSIGCPTCGTTTYIETVSELPKNLALLDVSHSDGTQSMIAGTRSEFKTKSGSKGARNLGSYSGIANNKKMKLDKSRTSVRKSGEEYCTKHNKKFEAYCMNKRKLMCIGCILENKDKQQNLASIPEALEKELNDAQEAYTVAHNLELKLQDYKDKIADFLRKLSKKRKSNEENIRVFFQQIVDSVRMRETEVRQKMNKDYDKEERKAVELVDKHDIQMSQLIDVKSMIDKMNDISDIQILKLSKQRASMIDECSYEPKQYTGKKPHFGLRLDTELKKLMQVLLPITSQAQSNREIVSNGGKKAKPKSLAKIGNKKNTGFTGAVTKNSNRKFNSFGSKDLSLNAGASPKRYQRATGGTHIPSHTQKRSRKKRSKKKDSSTSISKQTINTYGSPKSDFKIQHLKGEKMSILSDTITNMSNMNDTIQKNTGYMMNNESILKELRSAEKDSSSIFKKNSKSSRNKDKHSFLRNEAKGLSTKKSATGGQDMPNSILGDLDMTSEKGDKTKLHNISKITNRKAESVMHDETKFDDLSIIDRLEIANHEYKHTNSIYLIGGAGSTNCSSQSSSTKLLRYDIDDDKWNVMSIGYNMIKGGAVAQKNGNLAFVGGKNKQGEIQGISEYSVLDNHISMVKKESKFSNRAGFAIIQGESYFFVLGGNDGKNIVADAFCVSVTNFEGVNIPNMLIAREDLTAEIDKEGKLYAIGGYGGYLKTCLSSIEYFNPSSNNWEMLTEMSCGRRAPGCALLGDDLFVMGGHDGFKYLNSGEKFNLITKKWTSITTMTEARCMFSVVKDEEDNKFYILGGFKNEALDSTECYCISTKKWIKLNPMPDTRYLHASVLAKI